MNMKFTQMLLELAASAAAPGFTTGFTVVSRDVAAEAAAPAAATSVSEWKIRFDSSKFDSTDLLEKIFLTLVLPQVVGHLVDSQR